MFVIFARDFCNPMKGFFKGGTGKAVEVPDDIGMLPVDAVIVTDPGLITPDRVTPFQENKIENYDDERSASVAFDNLQADGEARLAANRLRFQEQLAAEKLAKKKK